MSEKKSKNTEIIKDVIFLIVVKSTLKVENILFTREKPVVIII